ncbi:hypothetical protein WP8S17C03_14300 [Metapseudomonas otitidis]|uniref:Uncharacterized protein n=1 Tax=Metapseudomonas otitidis TaxID=319939 RepID=A0A6S5RHF7_9GAMM|nr:hypothetical protein [Pseudomonas otitidis]BBT15381.1 hypothetical protein WP8S17C03_14300 [Pseudomonas otitidis]
MRIDGFTSSISLDRSPRQGSATNAFREVQREVEARRDTPSSPGNTQGFEQVAQPRKVEAGNASSNALPARPQDLQQPAVRNLSNRAYQAIASYSSTASFASEADAPEVLGLDLYA